MASFSNKTLVALLGLAFVVSLASSMYTFGDGDLTAAVVSEVDMPEEFEIEEYPDEFDEEEIKSDSSLNSP